MRYTDERYRRDLRRLVLARRMVHYEARTSTLAEWTSLTITRIRKLYRHEFAQEVDVSMHRRRGPPPYQVMKFCNSPSARSESGAAVAACRLHGVFPAETGPVALRHLVTLERGERICNAYESYLAHVREARFTLDQFIFLVKSLVGGDHIEVRECYSCQSTLVTERYALMQFQCVQCRATTGRASLRPDHASTAREVREPGPAATPSVQQSLF